VRPLQRPCGGPCGRRAFRPPFGGRGRRRLARHAQGCAQAIGGGIAAADDGNVSADFRPVAELMREQIHVDIGANEEVGGGVDAGQVLAGESHGHINGGAEPQKDGIVPPAKQLLDGDARTDVSVTDEGDARAQKIIPDIEHDLLGELEVRDYRR